MQECGISKNMLLSTVTEADLDDIVTEITRFFHQMFIVDERENLKDKVLELYVKEHSSRCNE